jgi:lipopolysaccharide transport system permease protein
MLGPLWITISMALLLIGMGPLYSTLFNAPMGKFFPHLTLGIIFWTFFTSTINDGCNVFINAARYLKQADFPASIFVWRSLARNLVQLAHHAVLYLPVALWAGIQWSPHMLLFIPGMMLVAINLHAITMSLGILCARFRDVTQIVTSVLQLLMFLTPVFWMPDTLSGRTRFILYNPLTQMLDVVRLPLLNNAPAPGTWWFLLCFTIVNVSIAVILYVRQRRHLAYWI